MNQSATDFIATLNQESARRLDAARANISAINTIKIPVIDESETEEAEIAWARDINTGEWNATIYFGDISEKE